MSKNEMKANLRILVAKSLRQFWFSQHYHRAAIRAHVMLYELESKGRAFLCHDFVFRLMQF